MARSALADAFLLDCLCVSTASQVYHTMVQQKRPAQYILPPSAPRFHAFRLSVPQDTKLFASDIAWLDIDVSPLLHGNRLEDGITSTNLPKVVSVSFVDSRGNVTAKHRYPSEVLYRDVGTLINDLEGILHVDARPVSEVSS